jgi:hypothetical protein
VTRIGATGHQELPVEAGPYILEHVRGILSGCSAPLRAVTALAAGADQLVAREVLRNGGSLYAIVPAVGYEGTFTGEDLREYEYLLAQADQLTRLDFPEPSEHAYWAAGKTMVDNCDVLVAIWDGEPARGLGGTGDVVAYAETSSKDVRVIWPDGVVRE